MYKNTFKKLNLITFLIFMLLVAFQTSCKEDETLDGSVWNAVEIVTEGEKKDTYDYTLSFFESIFTLNLNVRSNDGYRWTEKLFGTYNYSHPNVTLYIENVTGNYNLYGVISDNQLTIINNKDESLVFDRK